MKKFLAILSAAALAATMSAMSVSAYTDAYPASSKSEGMAAPTDGTIMIGTLIGSEDGWGGNTERGRDAAFDGYLDTFFDPHAQGDPSTYAGVKMNEAYVLTEIRICPRDTQLGRFNGAAIWGFNGDTFDPSTATLIWESDEPAEEPVFVSIKANQFIAGSNTGFTSFVYFNEVEHGDVAEVELYGNPVSAATQETPAAPAEVSKDDAPAETTAAPAPTTTTTTTSAPRTGNMTIVITLIVFAATAFVTIKMTRAKNKA